MERDVFTLLDCCGQFEPSDRMTKSADATREMAPVYASLYHKSVSGVVFGMDKNLNVMASLNYLMVYLDLILEQESGTSLTKMEKIDKYCLHKITEAFRCLGIDIRPALRVYHLYPFTDEIMDGIDFMAVEGLTPPINRVRS